MNKLALLALSKKLGGGGGTSGENKFAQVLSRTVTELTEDDLRGATKIADYAFYNCKQLVSVALPEGVTEITNRAFDGCSSLKRIVIPKSMAIFSNYAFYGFATNGIGDVYIKDVVSWLNITLNRANSYDPHVKPDADLRFLDSDGNDMTNITIPDGFESVRDYAFYRASKITSFSIPNTVTSIGEYAFWKCSSLKKVILKSTTPPIMPSAVFNNTHKDLVLTVPHGCGDVYKTATNWSAYADRIIEEDA